MVGRSSKDFEDDEDEKDESRYRKVNNGDIPKRLKYRMCERKNRYDEYTARRLAERGWVKRKHLLYVYQCPVCNGWHLTHARQE